MEKLLEYREKKIKEAADRLADYNLKDNNYEKVFGYTLKDIVKEERHYEYEDEVEVENVKIISTEKYVFDNEEKEKEFLIKSEIPSNELDLFSIEAEDLIIALNTKINEEKEKSKKYREPFGLIAKRGDK